MRPVASKYAQNTPPAGCGADDTDRLPKRLSPSRTQDFIGCPAKFYFRSILRIPSVATEAQAKGTLAHAAFEHLFDHPRGERTPDLAVQYVAPEWEKLRAETYYEVLVAKGPDAEAQLVADAQELVRRYFGVENPNRFDPAGRELKLTADVGGVPMLGIIDRLDKLDMGNGEEFVISDYKTGKVPAPDDRYLSDKFFGMRTYALLLAETHGALPSQIRLVFVAGGTPGSVRREDVTKTSAAAHKKLLQGTYKSMKQMAKSGEWTTKQQPLCQWCDHISYCPAWHPELAGLAPGDMLPEDVQVKIATKVQAATETLVDAKD